MQRQRHQSAIRVWRSNYINLILEHRKIPKGGLVARVEFETPGHRCSHTHDGDSIYRKHCRTASLHYEHAGRAGRYGPKVALGSRLWTNANSVTSSRPPLTFIQGLHPLCKWRERQLNK
ncbi:hypothetical protein Zmor_017922 [Zophobas morio]|uniref:Uncharacterized protein n=1 Tax=Zophobas morio TaxID=2755281 RepID=A0AA38IAI6_9CUCU|nr:hypothetical protein Zmor_017922 [Zophobas morio]